MNIGPQTIVAQGLHKEKYREGNESFKDRMTAIAEHTKDDDAHFEYIRHMLYEQRFLPAGRVQAAAGSVRDTTAFNCFVSDDIPDSLDGIMDKLKEAAKTMQLGGGIGYDFSTLRPRLSLIASLNSTSSGPIAFMDMFDAMCKTIVSAGHRRGAMMGVLRVDHPDIEEFIHAKRTAGALTQFNVSVGVTNAFMVAVLNDWDFDLVFEGRVYKTVKATKLWDEIMRNTWDHAEPGILFIDNINLKNNLWYCEKIAATNPCGEQPLPPYGACLLGSLNLVKFLYTQKDWVKGGDIYKFDYDKFRRDIKNVIPMMDNIIDRTRYPLPEQEAEAKNKRRMGIGVTGLANAIEAMGHRYGSSEFIEVQNKILETLRDTAYQTSVEQAIFKGSFPLFDADKYCEGKFIKTLPEGLQQAIKKHGIRNSHLLSIAPTGTISMCADAVSSGLEPVFAHEQERIMISQEGPVTLKYQDYGTAFLNTRGAKANDIAVQDHVNVLVEASKYIDSACSKTCNVGDHVTWEEFKEVYMTAWRGGASGCTTFRAAGYRKGILTDGDEQRENTGAGGASSKDGKDSEGGASSKDGKDSEGGACFFDLSTGLRECE